MPVTTARMRVPAAMTLAYVLLTALMGRHVLASLGSAIASDAGDPLLNAAILAWNALNVPWSDAWYQFPIFFPASDALTFSEHLLGLSVIATPLYWITGNGLTAYNLTLLLTYPLCALAMSALVWRLTRSAPAAFVAGLAFAFAPYRAAQLPHLQVLAVFWAPLALLGLHGFLESSVRLKPDTTNVRLQADRRWWWLALFAVCWSLQGAANGYFLVYFSVLVGFWVLWFVVAPRRWRELGLIAGAAGLAALPHLPILYRYVVVHERYGFGRGIEEVAFFSADIAAPVCPASGLAVWGWLAACRAEGELFLGPALAVLCCLGVWVAFRGRHAGAESRYDAALTRLRRVLTIAAIPFLAGSVVIVARGPWEVALGPLRATGSNPAKPFSTAAVLLVLAFACSRTFRRMIGQSSVAGFYMLAAVATWALSWGPSPQLSGVPVFLEGPFAWLGLLPGVDGLRVPARFWMMTVLCLSVLAGLGVAHVLARRSARASLALLVVAASGLVIDGWMSIPAASVLPPPPNQGILRGGRVLTLPIGGHDAAAEFRAIEGGWSSVNGASGYEPSYYEKLRQASREPDAVLFAPFVGRGDLHVVIDERAAGLVELVELVERQPGAEEIARRNGQRQYRIPRQGDPLLMPAEGARLSVASVSASCGEEAVALTRDGDPATRWHCGAQMSDQDVTVDLGAIVTAGAVVPALGAFSNDFPRYLVVETSVDGAEWQEAWNGAVVRAVLAAELRDPSGIPLTVSFAPRPARYVRLRQIGRDETWYWSIAELEVWSGTR